MRVLHIITGLNKGGAETLLCNLCQFDKEHEHAVISLSYVKDSQSLSSMHNFSLYTLNFPVGKIRVFGLFKLYKLIKKINPDAIQTWLIHADLIGGIAARFAGMKGPMKDSKGKPTRKALALKAWGFGSVEAARNFANRHKAKK